MPPFKSFSKLAKALSLISAINIGLLASGCADEPLVDPFVTPQLQTILTTDADIAPPLVQQPDQQTTQQPTQQIDQPSDQPSDQSSSESESFVALQRLQPAVQYDFTVIADGSFGTEVINYANSILVDEGDDTVLLTQNLPDSEIEACMYAEGFFLCLRVLENFNTSAEVPGGISVFTLDENNRGSGVFAICPDIYADYDRCIEQISNNTPTGTLNLTAALPSSLRTTTHNPLFNGGPYAQYLAQSQPRITIPFAPPSIEALEEIKDALHYSMSY